MPVKLSLTSLPDLIAAVAGVEVLEAGAALAEEGEALAAEEAVVEEDLEVELLGAGVGADLGAAGRIKSSAMLICRRCHHLFEDFAWSRAAAACTERLSRQQELWRSLWWQRFIRLCIYFVD